MISDVTCAMCYIPRQMTKGDKKQNKLYYYNNGTQAYIPKSVPFILRTSFSESVSFVKASEKINI